MKLISQLALTLIFSLGALFTTAHADMVDLPSEIKSQVVGAAKEAVKPLTDIPAGAMHTMWQAKTEFTEYQQGFYESFDAGKAFIVDLENPFAQSASEETVVGSTSWLKLILIVSLFVMPILFSEFIGSSTARN